MTQPDERISYFSTLCQELYNPKSSNEREQVQKILEASFPTFANTSLIKLDNIPSFNISNPTDTANALRILLENSPNPYVQTFCFSRLKQLVMAQFTIFDKETKLQLRTFLLEYAYIHPNLQPFVILQLASVFALITQFGWLDVDEYQNIYKDLNQFLQTSADHRIVGLQILTVIVQDVNNTSIPKYSAKFRKAAAGLRDTQLFDIFETAYQLLASILNRQILFDKPDQENRTKEATLNLLLKCLSFDFAGTTVDEAGEDTGMIQIPSSWRSLFEQEEFVSNFFKAYHTFDTRDAGKIMECLVQIAATRKALFSGEEEKNVFLNTIMGGIQEIILTANHLNDPDCYNAFCRLLHRFRMTAPLNTMAEKPGYMEWIELIANFTQSAFQSMHIQQGSCYYLLNFWSRLVQSMSYYQQLPESTLLKLQSITVDLTRTFINASMESVVTRIQDMLDDPLDDEESFVESLTMLGQIARCKYDQSCSALIGIFDPITVHYGEFVTQASMGQLDEESLKEANEIFESKFTWLVYTMAVFIENRPPYLGSDESDEADGKLMTKMIELMQFNQTLRQNNALFSSERLDLAIIYFFSAFRKSYIGESNATATYKVLDEAFDIKNETDMLNLMMTKIITNLQIWGKSEKLIRRTLELFHDLSSGYSALRNLRKIESTLLIMQNHVSDEFTFFNDQKHKHNRMLYYQVLCKILFAEDDCDREFYEFMKPFEVRLNQLAMLNTIEEYQQPEVQRALENLFRDLRGFIIPISSRKNYLLFFDWFYPEYMPVLIKGIQAWSPNPMTNSLLKFFSELVYNKSQRLNLDVSSPSGILLFKDASQILTTFGQHMITTPITDQNEKYPMKYKGISICFHILARCLGGKYINFGVFWLYQDKAINEAFSILLEMMMNIPLEDMMNFPKLTKNFFVLLDEFSVEQMMKTMNISAEAFLYIIEACEQGVESNDLTIRSHACSTINHIATHVIQKTELEELRQEKKKSLNPDGMWCLNYLNQFPHLLPNLLSTLFGLILFDDNNDQWHLSRPLYTLVLLQRDFAAKYTEQVILQQLPERREFITKALSNLMEGSGWTISTKDREKFSQQVSTLKRELNNNQIVLIPI